jgi:dTDP-4-dehydrorhamnose reductase
MKFEKILVFGAAGMLGTTLKDLSEIKKYPDIILTDLESSNEIEFCDTSASFK